MNIIQALIEDFKAWRRGEVRVAPRRCRGRVYARRDDLGGETGGAAGARLIYAGVIRADGGPDDTLRNRVDVATTC